MNPHREHRERGISLIEAMLAITVVGVAMLLLVQQMILSHQETRRMRVLGFGFQKAMAMIAEVQNAVANDEIQSAHDLEALADDSSHSFVLTTRRDEQGRELSPNHAMSGNSARLGAWQWSRSIEVERVHEQPSMRFLRVHVYHRRPDDGGWEPPATASILVTVPVSAYQPVKVFDVYALAIGAAPSTWDHLETLRTALENASRDLSAAQKGMTLRLHWISHLGYGRDPVYLPYVNEETPATEAAPFAYWYPGRLGESAGGRSLFRASLFSGRVRTETGVRNDFHAEENPLPHSVADQFNHCLRYPAADRLFAQRLEADLENDDEPPLQVLLEQMARDPDRYRNALFVNLHGSGIPLPPVRNYSDAARSPLLHPGVRVVSHPACLRTPRDPNGDNDHADSLPAEFRVYAYKTDPESGPDVLETPILVQIYGIDLSRAINAPVDPSLTIRRLVGGVHLSSGKAQGGQREYHHFDSEVGLAPVVPDKHYEMYYEAGYSLTPQPHTWIKLYNTPLVCPLNDNRGLDEDERLYGLEYIPSPVFSDPGFPRDLASTGGEGNPKNTARWRIRIPVGTMPSGLVADVDQLVTVVTRIGDDPDTGTMWPWPNDPHNRSETYTWWAASPEAVPFTERYQMLGDPRHNPYADLCAEGASFPNGYNWHFDDLRTAENAAEKWPGLDSTRLQDGFGDGTTADAPRLLHLLRQSLQRSGAVYLQTGGPAGRFLLLGGEVAMPATSPCAVSPVDVHGRWLGTTDVVAIDTMHATSASANVEAGRQLVVSGGDDPFYNLAWLGELAPDSHYATYLETGNLPTGSAAGSFRRVARVAASLPGLPDGTDFEFATGSELGDAGIVALFDAGTLDQTVVQRPQADPIGAFATEQAHDIAGAFDLLLPRMLGCTGPFGTALPFGESLPYFGFTDSYPKSAADLLETHFLTAMPTGSGTTETPGSGIVRLALGSDTAVIGIVGLSPSGRAQDLAASSLMAGIRGFHAGGMPDLAPRIVQLPEPRFLEPEEGTVTVDPQFLTFRWGVEFRRFDGESYTEGYPESHVEAEADLRYSLLFSIDGGLNWSHALDGGPAEVGRRPSEDTLILVDATTGHESLVLPTPAVGFPGAAYLFRLECYHAHRGVHLSHHQTEITIRRTK